MSVPHFIHILYLWKYYFRCNGLSYGWKTWRFCMPFL